MGDLVTAVGEVFGGLSEQGAANAQKQIARQNAEIAERNAALTMAAGEGQAERLGMKAKAQAGAIKTAQAARGVDIGSGSAVDVQESQAALSMFDAMTIKSNAAREAFGFKVQAKQFRDEAAIAKARANQAMWSAGINAFSSLVSGASSASSAYQSWQSAAGGGGASAGEAALVEEVAAVLAF